MGFSAPGKNKLQNKNPATQLGQAKTKQASKLSSTSSVLACPSC